MAAAVRAAPSMVRIPEVTKQGKALPLHRNLDQWLACYRAHRRVGADMIAYQSVVPELASLIGGMERVLQALNALPDDATVRSPQADACGRELLDILFACWSSAPPSTPAQAIDPSDPSFLSLWYFVAVVLPCMLLFQALPQHLLRRARHGDLRALGQLCLIDRSVAFEHRIRDVVHAEPDGWQTVQKIVRVRPPLLRPLYWRVVGAATMRVACHEVKYQLTHPAILDLFDAFARDEEGTQRDLVIPVRESRTFERQVTAMMKQRASLLMIAAGPGSRPTPAPTAGGAVVNARIPVGETAHR